MIPKTRLAKIERGLSPRELVLAWLDDVLRRFDALGKWLEWAARAPGESPYYKLPKAAMEAVAAGRKGRREDTQRAQEDAGLNTVFLVSLSIQCSEELEAALTRCEMMAALCARGLQVLLLRERLDEKAVPADAAGRGGDGDEAEDHPAGLCARDIAAVRSRIADLLEYAYLRRAVIRAIQRNYFAGREIMFRDTASRLAEAILVAERLADEFNDFIRDWADPAAGQGSPPPLAGETAGRREGGMIDLAEVRASAPAKVRAEVIFSASMAKAEALAQMDRREQATALALRAWKDRVACVQG